MTPSSIHHLERPQPGQQQQQQQLPREAKLLTLLLNSLNVADVEPGVVPMLMEFAHRYVQSILQDAQIYAEHASEQPALPSQTPNPQVSTTTTTTTTTTSAAKDSAAASGGDIELRDVKLAIQGKLNYSFTYPAPTEYLLELAEQVNKEPLPLPGTSKSGEPRLWFRLPPDEFCLGQGGFQVLSEKDEPPTVVSQEEHSLQQQQRVRADVLQSAFNQQRIRYFPPSSSSSGPAAAASASASVERGGNFSKSG